MQQQHELSEVLNLEYAIFLTHGEMVFSMLLCSMTRCRNSTQCIAKNVSLSVVCKSPANGGRFARIALKSFENYSPNSFSIFFMTLVLMVENSDLSQISINHTSPVFSSTNVVYVTIQNEELFQYYSSSKSSSADFAFNLPSFIILTSRSP